MKRSVVIVLASVAIVLGVRIGLNAQCAPKQLAYSDGGDTISVDGKIGECSRFKFSIDEGQRVVVKILSADNKARFSMQRDAPDDDTPAELFEDQTSLDRKFKYTDWLISVTGTAGTAYQLTIKVSD
ncbi:MAG: hypothetical protein ABJA02_05410 [Acidobacteriota bacterium]